jgi:hypothetical protein
MPEKGLLHKSSQNNIKQQASRGSIPWRSHEKLRLIQVWRRAGEAQHFTKACKARNLILKMAQRQTGLARTEPGQNNHISRRTD